MSKKIVKIIKLQIPAGKANPAPPIGPALVLQASTSWHFARNLMQKHKAMAGDILPVVITVYQDKSFTFIYKKPPVAEMLKKAAGSRKRICCSQPR